MKELFFNMYLFNLSLAFFVAGLVDSARDLTNYVIEGSSDEETALSQSPRFLHSTVCLGVVCPRNLSCDVFQSYYPICYNPNFYLKPDPRNDCPVGACRNGGTCNNRSCSCPDDTHGNNCETKSTPCSQNNLCLSNETCVTLSGGGFTCTSSCSSSPCRNGGTCFALPCVGKDCSDFMCLCPGSYAGKDCSVVSRKMQVARECRGRCLGEGCRCVSSCSHENGYYCVNKHGLTGKDCSILPPTVLCKSDAVIVRIPDAFIKQFKNTALNVSLFVSSKEENWRLDDNCRAKRFADGYELVLSFDACGSLNITESGFVTYKNTLWFDRIPDSTAFSTAQPVMDFNCSYATSYKVVTSLQPMIDQALISLTDAVKGKASLSLCKVSTCDKDCPDYLRVQSNGVYTVAQMIHATLKVDLGSIMPFQTDVVDAYLSCGSEPSALKEVYLYNGCDQGNLDVSLAQRTTVDGGVCMSFRVPKLHSCTPFYLHVRLRICTPTSFRARTCPNSQLRHSCNDLKQKRSLDSRQRIGALTVGPIYVVDKLRSGSEIITLKSDDGDSVSFKNLKHEGFQQDFPQIYIFIVSGLLLFSLFVLTILFVLYKRVGYAK